MVKKKILFFLATEKGYQVLRKLVSVGKKEYIAAVVSFHEIGVQKDFFGDIGEVCSGEGIDFYEWKDVKTILLPFIGERGITSCIAISWKYLIPLDINDYLEDKLIIFHDSLLPRYRGFAPIVTAMINGDKRVGASVLFATEQADRGDIIMQKAFDIDEAMHIQNVINQMAETYAELACELVENITIGSLEAKPQNEDEATYSIWRDEDDYWIDWRWTAEKIQRFVNALGYPYKGAKTRVDGDIIRITECSIEKDLDFMIRTPGKIWLLNNNAPIIICGSGLLRIDKALGENGDLYHFKKLRCRVWGITK